MKYIFRQSIWAVGQGGFSMGTLYSDAGSRQNLYTYVYDCGTDQLAALRRELLSAETHFLPAAERKIDTVFLSHLDADHVNGFDILCSTLNQRIDMVVLPYMDLESRYYLAAKAMDERRSSALFLEFVIDPVKWIGSRLPNAEILLLGAPAQGQDDLAPHDPPQVQPGLQGNNLVRPAVLALDVVPGPGQDTVYDGRQQYRWLTIQAGAAGAGSAPILLVAHVPPRSNARLTAFSNALKAIGFGRPSVAGLKRILADPAQREQLKECYSELASDHNILSMHLLVKSLCPVNAINEYYRSLRPHRHAEMGYLFSGDAKLSAAKYFDHWRNFYRRYLDVVTVFVLPHHGAKSSFSSNLLAALPGAVFVAQAGPNGYGHPSQDVVDEVQATRRFHQVDDNICTRIDVSYSLS